MVNKYDVVSNIGVEPVKHSKTSTSYYLYERERERHFLNKSRLYFKHKPFKIHFLI